MANRAWVREDLEVVSSLKVYDESKVASENQVLNCTLYVLSPKK